MHLRELGMELKHIALPPHDRPPRAVELERNHEDRLAIFGTVRLLHNHFQTLRSAEGECRALHVRR